MLMMKLGLLTCAFYLVLTAIVEAGLWAVVRFRGGFSVFFRQGRWFWSMGVSLGLIFGATWIISFSATWLITYQGLKGNFPGLAN